MRQLNSIISRTFLLAGVLLLAGCADAADPAGGQVPREEAEPREQSERVEQGEQVERARQAVAGRGGPRLVSLVPAVTETLFALGAGVRLVGVSDSCDYPPQVAELPRVGTFLAPVVEIVIKLEPDLVITSPSPGNQSAVRAIERAGIEVAVIDNEGSIEASRRAFTNIAALVGMEDAGRRLLSRIDGQFEKAARFAGSSRKQKVAVVVGREPLVLAGAGSYLGELVELVGATNVGAPLDGRWPRASLEYLLAEAPEVLVDVSMGSEASNDNEALTRRWGRFKEMPAVAEGRLYQDPSSLFLRPGPRLGDAALALAKMIHPE